VVEETIHNWTHHVGEDVLSNEVNGVLDDDNSEVDELMHHEGSDGVIVVEIRFSEVNISAVDDWVKVTMLIQLEISLEIEFEILEDQLDVAVVGEEPEVNILGGIDLPVLNGWEFDGHEGLVK